MSSVTKSWSRHESQKLDAGIGVTLAKILPMVPAKWLPTAEVKATKTVAIGYDIEFDDAQIQTVRDLGTAIRDRVRETETAASSAKYKADIRQCISVLCGGSYTYSGRTFSAKVRIKIASAVGKELKATLGWDQLGSSGFLDVVKNADDSIEIRSKESVVLAVESVDPSAVQGDLQTGGVCAKVEARDTLRGAIRNLAQGFIETYQCSVLYAGVELANSICPNAQAPQCGVPPVAGDDASVLMPLPVASGNACGPLALMQTYQCRFSEFDHGILGRGCDAFEREANISLNGGRVSLQCNASRSVWMHGHGGERLEAALTNPPLQMSLVHEFLSAMPPAEVDVLLTAWRDRFSQSQLVAARSTWETAVSAYNVDTSWPSDYSRTNWPEFQTSVLHALLDHMKNPANVPSGFNPGCPQLVMGWDNVASSWRVVSSTPQSKAGLSPIREFGRARLTSLVAQNFANTIALGP